MNFRKFILICGLMLLLSACYGKNAPTPQPLASIIPSSTPQASADATASKSNVEGILRGISPTSVQIEVNSTLQDYPALSKINKDATDLQIKIGDTVIVNLKNEVAQSIEKVLTKSKQ